MQTAETSRVPISVAVPAGVATQAPAWPPVQIEDFRYPESPFRSGSGFFPQSAFDSDSGNADPGNSDPGNSDPGISDPGHADSAYAAGARPASREGAAPASMFATGEHTQSFEYPAASGLASPRVGGAYNRIEDLAAEVGYAGSSSSPNPAWDEGHAWDQARLKHVLAEEARKAEERGHILGFDQGMIRGREEGLEQGRHQGREQARVRFLEEGSRQIEEERGRLYAQAASLVESFARTKEHYLHQLEEESVQLSLAIAARILRREAQADPLLLTSSVRVALGQLAASTTVRICVPAVDHPLWQEALQHMPGLPLRPLVVSDPQMELGECRVVTELGIADLGLWAQLKTVEKCFFERGGMPAQSASERPPTTASQPQDAASSAAEVEDGD